MNGKNVAYQECRQVEQHKETRVYFVRDQLVKSEQVFLCNKTDKQKQCFVLQSPSINSVHLSRQVTSNGTLCSAIVLTNLADPKWIHIPCKPKVAHAVYCSPDNLTGSPTQEMEIELSSSIKFCTLNIHILINGSCFFFLWYNSSHLLQRMNQHRNETDIKRICSLFHAVSPMFPPIFSPLLDHTAVYTRCAVEGKMVTKPSIHPTEAFVVLQGMKTTFKLKDFANLFICQRNIAISVFFQCDGVSDCAEGDVSDEEDCKCTNTTAYNSKCKLPSSTGSRVQCSGFYFLSRDHTCVPFVPAVKHLISTKTDVHNNQASQSCCLSNDIFANGDDALLRFCISRGTLPCRFERKCFEVHDICVYKMDKSGQLEPCQMGDHIQECKKFSCSRMAQCPAYYCIPSSYQCNGKWDCPSGEDESTELCSTTRQCGNMFKCRKTSICVHLSETCDGNHDCPHHDDELSCLEPCVSICQCYMAAIQCSSVILSGVNLDKIMTYHAAVLTNVSVASSSHQISSNIRHLVIEYSTIEYVCEAVSKLLKAKYISLKQNSISSIQDPCFSNLRHLNILKLDFNLLTVIPKSCFPKRSKLSLLNLTENPLVDIDPDAFDNLIEITLLSCFHSQLTSVAEDLFADTPVLAIETDNYVICCFVKNSTKCTRAIPWYLHCKNILPSISSEISYITNFVCSVFLNGLSLILINYFPNKPGESGAYDIIMKVTNAAHILLSLSLIFISAASKFYSGVFVNFEYAWKSNVLCFVLSSLLLFHNIFYPALAVVSTRGRLMVVKYPLESKFKDVSFIKKVIGVLTTSASAVVLGFSLIFWWTAGHVPSELCVPFVDPTDTVVFVPVLSLLNLVFQCAVIITVTTTYVLLVKNLKDHEETIQKTTNRKKSHGPIICQIIIDITSKTLSWIPISVVFITALFLPEYPSQMLPWCFVTMATVSSVIDPVVFVVTSRRKRS